jgi:cyclopropane fatty-acyl-phospholipid synthase-like methyltransferase
MTAVKNELPTRTTFENLYAGKPPWDIGKPQKPFVKAADRVQSPLLDAGCGTGDTALFFAERGLHVTGIDFLEEPLRRARLKAEEKGFDVHFKLMDARDAAALRKTTKENGKEAAPFASIIDSGLFHVFSDDDRRRYVRALAQVIEAGGRLFLMCFSDKEPEGDGPRRVSQQELHEAFADDWDVESIEPVQFEINPETTGMTFSEGGPKAWFAVIRRR